MDKTVKVLVNFGTIVCFHYSVSSLMKGSLAVWDMQGRLLHKLEFAVQSSDLHLVLSPNGRYLFLAVDKDVKIYYWTGRTMRGDCKHLERVYMGGLQDMMELGEKTKMIMWSSMKKKHHMLAAA